MRDPYFPQILSQKRFGSIPTHLCMLSQVKIRNKTKVQCARKNFTVRAFGIC